LQPAPDSTPAADAKQSAIPNGDSRGQRLPEEPFQLRNADIARRPTLGVRFSRVVAQAACELDGFCDALPLSW